MHSSDKPLRFLTIAGSDSGGGAGIQADIKTATLLGLYSASVVTALTAQNTCGVTGILPAGADFTALQLRTVLDDIGTDVIKTGMLYDAQTILAIAKILKTYPLIPLVVDPVMIAKGGSSLLENSAIDAMKTELFPLATVVTPNIPELEALTGYSIKNEDDMEKAGKELLNSTGCRAVFVKGGHLEINNTATDMLITSNDIILFQEKYLHTTAGHGTGCTLASAMACYLAKGYILKEACGLAKKHVYNRLCSAPALGKGHAPLGF